MLSKIKQFFANRKARKEIRIKMKGYGYASTKLFYDGEAAITELEHYVKRSWSLGEYSPFDDGIIQALDKFKSYGKLCTIGNVGAK